MIKTFVFIGTVSVLAVAYLIVFAATPISQLPPQESLLTEFRAEGYVPQALNLEENPEIEHGIFEVPARDEVELEKAMANAAQSMPGMNMGGGQSMDMSGDAAMDGDMATDANGNMDASADMNSEGTMDMTAQNDGATDGGAMDGASEMDAEMRSETGQTMDMAPADATAMNGTGNMDETAMDMAMPEGGLLIAEDGSYDREIDLTMSEWGYSDMSIQVTKGERIRFNVKNGGQILHEFMIMQMPAMQAVNYRMRRADWSLLEHEALYEQALVLPGGEFSFVMEVQEDGAWMFMCMLPYHMEMGMMGQMSTPGMAMSM